MANIDVTGSNAALLGAMMDVDTVKELAEAGDIAIKQKNGSPRMLMHLVGIYGASAVSNFPRPGSKAKDFATSNVLTDFGPWGDEGKTTSWYDIFFSGSTIGKKIYSDIRKHADGKATHPNEAQWEAEKSALDKRKGAAIARIKEAIKLNQMLIRVNQDTEAVATISLEADDQTVVYSNKCIFVRDEKMTKFKQWSVGQFLSVDVDWCEEQKDGATYDNVVKSIKRGAGETTTVKIKVTKPEEFDDAIAASSGYLASLTEKGNEKEYRGFVSHLNQPSSDYLLLSIDNFYTQLEQYLELPSNKERLQKLQEAGGMPALLRARNAA